ncbi:lipase 1 [Calliphora vicina]|uniref:lipase 1 n=1 Tax=Calliphora vicina TaxID=7373 RepID=UPI00325B7168
MPRVSLQIGGKPFLWHFFGHNNVDKDIDETSREIDDQSPAYEKLNWSTSDWITKHNYTLEHHHVVTADGYNLTLHRMPRPGHRPILLIHGLLTSSLAWVIMGPAKSLAFQLFNNYYDVWLANMRGSPWSRNHSRFTIEDSDFWSFSFHEWGSYDLPAIVDHILLLIGHSQALNAILVMCSLLPQYNERLQFVQSLAPTVALKGHVKFGSEDVRKVMKFIKNKSKSQEFELLPKQFMRDKCVKSSERRECEKWLHLLAGSGQSDKLSNTLLYGQLLRGGSLKSIRHLQQIWKSGDFVAYDYEPAGNLLNYRTVEPLNYDLKKVSVPMVLYFGETDNLASPEGVHHIYAHLLEGIKGVYRIAAAKFNHFDFFISSEVKPLLNNRLIEDLDKFLKHQLKYIIE